ncbi:MAG: N-acetyltransferase family protein [Gammaproteobacteria bacterium]
MIRRAVPDDIPRLLPLVADYWRFEGIAGFEAKRVTHSLEQLLSTETSGAGWIADDDAGYLLVTRGFSLEYGGPIAAIDEFFVRPQRRGTGLGAALLTAAEEACRAAGCVRLELELGRGNDAARGFYARHGFMARSGYELLEKML